MLAFARPGHILFGSDWPFAPTAAGQYFANGLDTTLDASTLTAIKPERGPCGVERQGH